MSSAATWTGKVVATLGIGCGRDESVTCRSWCQLPRRCAMDQVALDQYFAQMDAATDQIAEDE